VRMKITMVHEPKIGKAVIRSSELLFILDDPSTNLSNINITLQRSLQSTKDELYQRNDDLQSLRKDHHRLQMKYDHLLSIYQMNVGNIKEMKDLCIKTLIEMNGLQER
jgi:hypothetical protein